MDLDKLIVGQLSQWGWDRLFSHRLWSVELVIARVTGGNFEIRGAKSDPWSAKLLNFQSGTQNFPQLFGISDTYVIRFSGAFQSIDRSGGSEAGHAQPLDERRNRATAAGKGQRARRDRSHLGKLGWACQRIRVGSKNRLGCIPCPLVILICRLKSHYESIITRCCVLSRKSFQSDLTFPPST
jgi:hypothetical protein